MFDNRKIRIPARDLYGSRFRCLMLTHQPREKVALALSALVWPHASVEPEDVWLPGGFEKPAESKLGPADGLIDASLCSELEQWWLRRTAGANRPNWDLASTIRIGDRRGLLLIEAKAHANELSRDGKSAGDAENDARIRSAIAEANEGLNADFAGWNLTADSHYQLCNRLAWSWKIASAGVPVILMYLGFLDCEDMAKRGKPFTSAEEWEQAVRMHSETVTPRSAWGREVKTKGAILLPLIRTLRLSWKMKTKVELT